jgi:hypothetical protein
VAELDSYTPHEFSLLDITDQSYHYEFLQDMNSIKLLRLKPGLPNSSLSCELIVTEQSNKPAYEALSYVWGDASQRSDIQCNGKMLPTSLITALKQVRHPSLEKVLSADAICIYQYDISDKNQQISLKSDIYRNAETVIAWLGDDQGSAPAAFQLLANVKVLVEDIKSRSIPDSRWKRAILSCRIRHIGKLWIF